MEIEIIKPGNGASVISVDGNKKLAVTTNLVSKIYKQISRQELLSKSGFLIKEGISTKWVSTESLELKGKLIFPGPYYEGRTLADTDLDIDILLKLAAAFQTIIKENIPVSGYYLPGIFIQTDGGVLIFPPSLINYITSQLSEEENIEYWQPFNHPDISGEMQFSFTLGVLAYNILTKELPFTGTSLTEIREKMRSSKPVAIELLAPGINKNIAAVINRSFSSTDVNLEEWIKILKLWKNEGSITNISNEEKVQIKKNASKKQSKRKKQFERKQFYSRNWKTIGIIIAVLVFIVSFSIGPIKNALEPPITTGMSAEEVVDTYYRAIIDMDVEIMEDCVDKGIGKNDINEVTQLFVISRVRKGYEGTSGLVSASDWNDGIITNLEPGEQVYGIADLTVTGSVDHIFYADYIKWYPNIQDDTESMVVLPPTKVFIRDIITMGKLKDVWRIISLERKTMEKK